MRGSSGAPGIGPAASKPSASSHMAHLARIRDNQRRSRARRKEYLNDLEDKFRHCEQQGVTASAEMQEAARRVLEENRRLREILLQKGIATEEIETLVPSSSETPESEAFPAAKEDSQYPSPAVKGLADLLRVRKPCCSAQEASQGCDPHRRTSSNVSEEQLPSASTGDMAPSPVDTNVRFGTAATNSPVPESSLYRQPPAAARSAPDLASPAALAHPLDPLPLPAQQQRRSNAHAQPTMFSPQAPRSAPFANFTFGAPANLPHMTEQSPFAAPGGPIPQGAVSGYIQFVPVFTSHSANQPSPSQVLGPMQMQSPMGPSPMHPPPTEALFNEPFDMSNLISPSTQEQLLRGLQQPTDGDGGWLHADGSGSWGTAASSVHGGEHQAY